MYGVPPGYGAPPPAAYGSPPPGYSAAPAPRPAAYSAAPGYGAPPPAVGYDIPGYGAPPAGYPPPQVGYPPPQAAGYMPPPAGAYPPPAGYPPQACGYGAPPGYGYGGSHSSRDRSRGRDARDRDKDRDGGGGGGGGGGGRTRAKKEKEKVDAAGGGGGSSSSRQAPDKSSGPPDGLTVSGCQHATVGNIVRGEFLLHANNHNRPVYKKSVQVNGLDVMLYFWDDRDGANFCGWWFGPKVGGDQVWAYHPDKVDVPPASGWKVPYDGPVDPSFIIAEKRSFGPENKKPDERQAEERKRQEEDKRKKEEEAKRREQLEEKKRQLEKMRKEQEEELQKRLAEQRRLEEEAKKRAEEEARQREVEAQTQKVASEQRRIEQRATLSIRRVIQKIKAATPETYDELDKELKEVLQAELENTGTQKQRMQEEIDKGVEQAKLRVEQINLARKREQEKKEDEERKKREIEDHVRKLVQELEQLVETAEKAASALRETAEPLEEANNDMSVADVEKTAESVEEHGLDAKKRTKACTDFILQRGVEMRDLVPAMDPGQPLVDGKQTLTKLLKRIFQCTRTAESTVVAARGTKDSAVRRARARDKTKEIQALFNKYDKDNDKLLSKAEVVRYARMEYKFCIPEDAMNRLWRNLVEDGAKGVSADRFQALKLAIGVARERERDVRRRKEREEKEAILNGLKAHLSEKVKEAAAAVEAAEKDVAKADKQVQPLNVKAKSMSAPDMCALADETDEIVKDARQSIADARKHLDALGEGIDEDDRFASDLKAYLNVEAKQLNAAMAKMETRLTRSSNLSARFRDQAGKKRGAELEKARVAMLKVLRYNQRVRGLTKEQLFDAFDTNGDGDISLGEFLSFFASADKELRDLDAPPPKAPEAAKPEAPAEASEGGTKADKADAAAGDKEAAVDKDAAAKDDGEKTATGSEEVPAVPSKEGEKGVADEKDAGDKTEIAAKAKGQVSAEAKEAAEAKDSAAAKAEKPAAAAPRPVEVVDLPEEALTRLFPTVADESERLTREAFYRLVRQYYKVVKETALTDTLRIKGATALRRLEPDEVVEALDSPVREETSGLLRVRVKGTRDDIEGWATVVGNQGTAFLRDGGGLFKVVKETIFTESFSLAPAPADKESKGKLNHATRKVKEGEVLEVWEWPRREEKSGLVRMRCKAKSDGAIGWLTTTGNQGAVFAEPL